MSPQFALRLPHGDLEDYVYTKYVRKDAGPSGIREDLTLMILLER